MKNAWKGSALLMIVLSLSSCKAWNCGCPMSDAAPAPVEQDARLPEAPDAVTPLSR